MYVYFYFCCWGTFTDTCLIFVSSFLLQPLFFNLWHHHRHIFHTILFPYMYNFCQWSRHQNLSILYWWYKEQLDAMTKKKKILNIALLQLCIPCCIWTYSSFINLLWKCMYICFCFCQQSVCNIDTFVLLSLSKYVYIYFHLWVGRCICCCHHYHYHCHGIVFVAMVIMYSSVL